jgi:localization factor PodJL
MAQTPSWNMRGLDPDVREAAKEAARRSGLTVSDWLESLIRDEAVKAAAQRPQRASADIGARMRALSTASSGIAGRAARREPEGFEVLIEQAQRLEARTRETETRTTSALESIASWIEKAEGRMLAAERSTAERQERATSVIADAIKNVNSRVTDVERHALHQRADDEAPRPVPPGRPARPVLNRNHFADAVNDIRARQRDLDGAGMATVTRAAPDGAWPHVERRAGARSPEVTPLMNSLRADLAQLRGEIAKISQPVSPQPLEDSIRELVRQLETRQQASPADVLAEPLTRIENELARLRNGEADQRLARVEQDIQKIADRIEALGEATRDPKLLASAIHELSGLKDALQRQAGADQVHELADRIQALSQELVGVRDEVARGPGRDAVDAAIDDMRQALLRETREVAGVGHGLLNRITHQLDAVAGAMQGLPRGGLDDADRSEISAFSRKLDQLATRTQPESDLLARRIEELAARLDELAKDRSSAMVERLDRLSAQVEQLAAGGPSAIEAQIERLSNRIDMLAASNRSQQAMDGGAVVDFTPIEAMIGDLARRIEDVARPDTSNEQLSALERQIGELAVRLDARPAAPASTDALERTLHDLARSLGGLREETASAVDRATRSAVAEVMESAAQTPAPAPEIALIRKDIAGLMDVHTSIDQRTHSAIGAVNDTLETIVRRLAQLEDEISRERPAEPPRRAGHALMDARMPEPRAPDLRPADAGPQEARPQEARTPETSAC